VTEQKKIFGTDGVRGIANVEPVTAETSLKLGRAAAHVFTQLNPRKNPEGTRPKIVLGKDTRLSGYMLENALVAGITSLGVDVHRSPNRQCTSISTTAGRFRTVGSTAADDDSSVSSLPGLSRQSMQLSISDFLR